MSPALSAFRRGAAEILGYELGEAQVSQFGKYLEILNKWQSIHRLLGSTEPDWIVRHIFLDSLLFLRVLPPGVRDVLDVGSGAGVPGLPLKLAIPSLQLTMVESRHRRASFLAAVVRELGLTGARVVAERLESVAVDLADRFDVVVARCAGNVGFVFGLGAHLVRPGGLVVASGPPEEHPLPAGHWVTVPGLSRGDTRRFAVYSRPQGGVNP